LPGGEFDSEANAVSPDGLAVVGRANSTGDWEAFLWTEESGMIALGDSPGGLSYSSASDVSLDGRVVVGGANRSGTAFIWDALHGMRNLRDVLVNDLGLDLTGWTLHRATAMSEDGSTIVGWGTNPDRNTEAWLVRIPTPALPGDFDEDGDVDLIDYEMYLLCVTGPQGRPVEPACQPGDVDRDRDVDFANFAPIQRAFHPAG
jgi:hypothetical protein